MRFRACLWLLLGAAHLIVVVFGACHWLPDRTGSPLAETLRWYARLSGADSEYGFFSPEVGSEHRTRFLLEDDHGSPWSDAIDRTSSREARLRLNNIADYPFMSGAAVESPALRQELVKSWAAAMFSRHPNAIAVTVVVEAYDVPSMADYRAGQRPSWKQVYEARLQREPSTPKEGTEP
jgi:hypothetical protein